MPRGEILNISDGDTRSESLREKSTKIKKTRDDITNIIFILFIILE